MGWGPTVQGIPHCICAWGWNYRKGGATSKWESLLRVSTTPGQPRLEGSEHPAPGEHPLPVPQTFS